MPDLGGKPGKWARDLFRPVEREWMIERQMVDVTSTSLRGVLRRGTLVVPGQSQRMIES